MKKFGHLLLSLLFYFSPQAYAQLPIHTDIRLNDPLQWHKLTTTDGQTLIGRVMNYDDKFVRFNYRGSELLIPFSNVKLVEPTTEESIHAPPPTIGDEKQDKGWFYDYKVVLNNPKEHLGKLVEIDQRVLYLEYLHDEYRKRRFSLDNITSIELLGKKITEFPFELSKYHRMILRNGNILIGQLLSFNGDTFEFLMKNGSAVVVTIEDVISIRLEKMSGRPQTPGLVYPTKQFFFSQQRAFFSPSAFLLEKGIQEYRNTMIMHNTIDYGLAENVTIGGGISTLLFINAVSAKVKIGGSLSPLFHAAVGVQGSAGRERLDGYGFALGLLYGAASFGTKEKFLTASVGLGLDHEGSRTAGVSFNGSIRTSENWRVFLEFMHFNPVEDLAPYSYKKDNTSMGSVGLGWLRNSHQIDFGFYTNNTISLPSMVALPVVAYSYRF